MHIPHFDIDLFLRDYWQKRPLLIRNPWGQWANPLEPDELAGLACEEAVESRLILHDGEGLGDRSVEHGPFSETQFEGLGQSPWTLLVQAVDHHVPDVATLLDPFRFIPNWRIDDVMVSYATDGGGVGPHFDQYDVFLVQGLGRRRWRVGPACDSRTPLLPHEDLRLLADFEATDEWILEPGDILYVPPRVAHDGIAVGDDCMTYSIGFRAPARSELLEQWCDDLVEQMEDDDRYEDPAIARQDNPGELTAPALARLHAITIEKLLDRDAFARWFGQYNSRRKYPDMDWRPDTPVEVETVRALVTEGAPLLRNAASRFAFIRQAESSLLLFADGESFACAEECAAFAERLCARDQVPLDPGLAESDAALALIAALVNQGSVAFDVDV